MPDAEIDGVVYDIALGEKGETLWQTIRVAEERDEVWDDWSAGIGETKRTTGRGYLWAEGFDATARGALKLSPHYLAKNNTALTTAFGYFAEDVRASAATLTIDASSTGKASLTSGSSLTVSHTIAAQIERVLLVWLFVGSNDVTPLVAFGNNVTYGGAKMTPVAQKTVIGGVNAVILLFSLLNPATGANNIVVTNGGASTYAVVLGGQSLYGVDQDTPFGTIVSANGTDGTPTVTVSTAAGEQVVAGVAVDTNDSFTAGTNETERWDDAQSTDITGAGYTQAGSDGGVMAPSIDGAATDWVEMAVPVKQAAAGSRSLMYILDTTKIFQYFFDPITGLDLVATDTTTSGVAGQPARMNGNWYAPMGNSATAQKLTGETWADVTGTWKANHLATFQKGVTPTLARVNSATPNKVELNADTGDVTDAWTNETQSVGNTSTDVTSLAEAGGELYVFKTDSAYGYGTEAESRNIVPFEDTGKQDSDNGKGSMSFGDEIIYLTKGNVWRYRIGGGALPIGPNTIESWRTISAIDTPKDGRPLGIVHVGKYWYMLLNDGEDSHLMQGRKSPGGSAAGEVIWNSVLTIPLSKGLGKDSLNRLWMKGATTDETKRDIRVIQLAEDGSLDVENRRGQASADHTIYLDERNPGRPQDQVQIRRMTVESEGDWNATTSLQLGLFRDNATTTTTIGSAITSSGVTTRNPTVGASDTAYRFRPDLVLTTNSSYAPLSSDPQILRVIVGIRFPEILRIVVVAEDTEGTTSMDVEQNLRRLQNQGVVTFRRPGDTTTTFSAEVTSVTDIMYATQEGYAHGLELQVTRWITP